MTIPAGFFFGSRRFSRAKACFTGSGGAMGDMNLDNGDGFQLFYPVYKLSVKPLGL
jgi:hypothetical protein